MTLPTNFTAQSIASLGQAVDQFTTLVPSQNAKNGITIFIALIQFAIAIKAHFSTPQGKNLSSKD